MPRLLITGVTGLIGRAVLNSVLAAKTDYHITALIRPETVPERYAAFRTELEIVKLDLADTSKLTSWLKDNAFDAVLHIGALRGGRKFNHQEYLRANYICTQALAEHCLQHNAKFMFCSSVGVFGAIPEELPANNQTERNPDNFYHYTKIESEKMIQRMVTRGLKAAILRPSVTYGIRDRGFPYQMVKMVHTNRFPLINKRVWLHLCHVDTISRAFTWLLLNDYKPGLAMNVADREPVQLQQLVNFISRELRGENYGSILKLDRLFFRWGEQAARLVKNELWISRFQLISRSWFYQVADTYELMGLTPTYTIPDIRITIADYLGK
ncbi:MAG: NAD(P)-dependent oxidoreductase [Candidatus Cloacimonetes bacterium]|jgi:nucleoside-diphosphate-sugar epimerase|nr:NAD(P)-dependent oxidoreductase [Candidatus Cloacimonadota bacterium]HOY85349.1 NAD(P)-dependent oxidoreductase [Candidatus Syntrophosphaera sp.]HPH60257.1 NAD(P)-dependent oxidoreductase [Candidatus Syntrophosphaera sp.]